MCIDLLFFVTSSKIEEFLIILSLWLDESFVICSLWVLVDLICGRNFIYTVMIGISYLLNFVFVILNMGRSFYS